MQCLILTFPGRRLHLSASYSTVKSDWTLLLSQLNTFTIKTTLHREEVALLRDITDTPWDLKLIESRPWTQLWYNIRERVGDRLVLKLVHRDDQPEVQAP